MDPHHHARIIFHMKRATHHKLAGDDPIFMLRVATPALTAPANLKILFA